jgi:hypothetical protein
LTIPNGYRPSLVGDLSGNLHGVWECVQPIDSTPNGIFSRYRSSIVYRRRGLTGLLSDSVVIGKGFVPFIQSKNGTEYVLFVEADSSNQLTANLVLSKGIGGAFAPAVPLYSLNASTLGNVDNRFDQFALFWEVDSSGMVHIIQRVYNYPFNKIEIIHYSSGSGVQIDSLNDLSAQHRFRPDGSVSLYRIVPGTPSWTMEQYLSKSGSSIQKLHSYSIPANVLLSQIIADKNGNEHLVFQEAANDQSIFLVRYAASDTAKVTLIGKGYIAGNSAFVDAKNSVLFAGAKAGKPVLLSFSLDSVTAFQDFHFPLAIGNEWYYNVYEFSDPGGPPPPTQETARADSMKYMPNGKQYIRITSKRWMPSYYRKEGLRVYQYSPADSQEYLRMDFTKRQGDTVGNYGPFDFQKVILQQRTMHDLFSLKQWSFLFQGTVPKLDSVNIIQVMDSIGIIGRSVPIGPTWVLIGAKLGEKEYGIILSAEDRADMIPDNFKLFQNYPNPFNPSTTISYQLSALSHTKLSVYDVIGREVAVLLNERKGPGTYSVTWDASRCTSGIYFVHFSAGNYSSSIKLMLLK